MTDSTPGYYAVIPASVRYDDALPSNAKLLYGEISALIGAEGFCFANNAYFAQLYKLSERTVSSLISKLQKEGYIVVDLDRDETGQIRQRKLFLKESVPDGQPLENIFHTPRKDFPEGIEKNFQYTNTSITNIEKENIKEKENRKNKKGGCSSTEVFNPLPQFVQWIVDTFGDGEARERKNDLYFAFVRFSDNRTALKKPFKTQMAVTSLCNRLLRLTDKSEDKLVEMIDLLDASTINGWQSVYQRGDAPARQKPAVSEGRRYEEL